MRVPNCSESRFLKNALTCYIRFARANFITTCIFHIMGPHPTRLSAYWTPVVPIAFFTTAIFRVFKLAVDALLGVVRGVRAAVHGVCTSAEYNYTEANIDVWKCTPGFVPWWSDHANFKSVFKDADGPVVSIPELKNRLRERGVLSSELEGCGCQELVQRWISTYAVSGTQPPEVCRR